MATKNILRVSVWRGAETGAFDRFEIPSRDNQTVLDVVTEIQRVHDSTLSYRFACRVGVCGSCAMKVNGRPRWTCRTHVKKVVDNGHLKIEPLSHLPRIKDLTCDMTLFFEKWQRAGGVFSGTLSRHDAPPTLSPDGFRRRAASAGIECINCAVCYSACDVVGWSAEYLGPAALNRAWTLWNDDRQSQRKSLLDRISGDGGCTRCHTEGKCTEFCPVELSPTRSIAGLKRMSLLSLLGLDSQ